MKNISRSVLLKTSAGTDLVHSNGNVKIAGLDGGAIRFNDILDIIQIKQRDEVVQVLTVGGGSYTPAASTTYSIEVSLRDQRIKGWQGFRKKYGYTTPAIITNIGASAALQREYIHTQIINKINADNANFMTAASLLLGTGFTLTDDAGYFPARVNGASNGRGGKAAVITITNADGSGWTSSNITTTTNAVYGFGIGTRMAQDEPSIYSYTGNLISGELDAPKASDGTFATAGQKYDAFVISSLGIASAHAVSDQLAHTPEQTLVYVDNGEGTSTANATGFAAFEKSMHRLVGALYQSNPTAIVEFFDNIGTFSGSATPAPTGATGDVNQINTGANTLQYFVKGIGSTILAPYATVNGLPLSLDAVNDEGMELSAPVGTNSPKEFTIGVHDFSMIAKINLDDISGTDALYVGFRKKAAHTADPNDYTDMATLGLDANAGALKIMTALNNAAVDSTATTDTWANGETRELEIRVFKDGSVKFFVDGVERTSVQTTAFEFDATDVVIPFISFLNTANVATPLLKELLVLPNSSWRA